MATISLPDADRMPDDAIEVLRLRAIHAREQGYTEELIADVLGVARETVSRWWVAYQRGGLDALPHRRTGRPKGSGRVLTPEQEAYVRQQIDTGHPGDLDINSALWTRRAVAELIRKRFGVEVAVRTVGTYLRRWGYTPKRPARVSRKQDPEEVAEWLETTFPEVKARAEQEGAEVWFCDECGVRADEVRGRGYARVGETPNAKVPARQRQVNVISAISSEGEVQFMTYRQTLSWSVFVSFLTLLIAGSRRKVVLVVDRLQAHVTDEVLDWLADHQDRIELVLLPTYAPELNPVEYLNNALKGDVGREELPSGVPELEASVSGFLEKLRDLPKRVRDYFCHPSVKYATTSECD